MEPRYFFVKLIAPRPGFAFDMTDPEKAIMALHIEYWKGLVQEKKVLVFGPVLDMSGPYGIAIVEARVEDEVRQLTSQDPVEVNNLDFKIEIYPMQVGGERNQPHVT